MTLAVDGFAWGLLDVEPEPAGLAASVGRVHSLVVISFRSFTCNMVLVSLLDLLLVSCRRTANRALVRERRVETATEIGHVQLDLRLATTAGVVELDAHLVSLTHEHGRTLPFGLIL